MKNKIILSAIFLIAVLVNMHVFTDAFSDTAIPKFRPFGTSTTFADSTSYVTLNKGFYVRDSIKTDKDLIVKGAVVLDTLRLGKIQYRGNGIYLSNDKAGGNMTFQLMDDASGSAGDFTWLFGNYLSGQVGMTLDSATGLTINRGDIQFQYSTQQIKLPKDTVSDYASADAVTINRQSGTVTTKSLTTASGDDYTITINNSLVSATTNVWAMIKTNSGSGAPLVRQCATGSGTITVIIRNLGSGSLNSAISFQFLLVN